MTGRLAAVTGGTGFLGSLVVQGLLAEGWRVRQLVRTPREAPGELVEGSLSDEASLQTLVAGADIVVHMAGLTKCREAKGFRYINVGGARNLGHAIRREAPTARVVAVSSLAAREPTLSPYAASKAAGEVALLDTSQVRSFAVLRPCALYGPGDLATLPVFRAAKLPLFPLPHRPLAMLALLHVADAARAVVACCGRERGQDFWELGEGAYRWQDVARAAARALGRDPSLLPVPDRLLSAAAGLMRMLPGDASPFTSPGKIAEILHADWTCDASRLPPVEMWRPTLSLQEGFDATVGWYRRQGWL